MAAASPSSATAQPGCPAVQGIPPFHPFLPDVLMEAPRPPAKGWVALLWLPCRQNPGMLPHPSQPRVPVLNLAALAVSLALQEGNPLPRTGVTPGFVSLAHPRGKEMEAWHSMAPMAPCPSCLSAPSVAGLSEGDPWILATGKPQESHQSLPEAWAPPLLSPEQGNSFPPRLDPLMPAHLNPYGMQRGGFGLSLISQETPMEKVYGLFYAVHPVWASVSLWMCPGSPSRG